MQKLGLCRRLATRELQLQSSKQPWLREGLPSIAAQAHSAESCRPRLQWEPSGSENISRWLTAQSPHPYLSFGIQWEEPLNQHAWEHLSTLH